MTTNRIESILGRCIMAALLLGLPLASSEAETPYPKYNTFPESGYVGHFPLELFDGMDWFRHNGWSDSVLYARERDTQKTQWTRMGTFQDGIQTIYWTSYVTSNGDRAIFVGTGNLLRAWEWYVKENNNQYCEASENYWRYRIVQDTTWSCYSGTGKTPDFTVINTEAARDVLHAYGKYQLNDPKHSYGCLDMANNYHGQSWCDDHR